MTKKGEYSLDFNSGKVIVDGHEFIQSECTGIFKSIDDYMVNVDDWISDERNKDLSILAYHCNGKSRSKILLVFYYTLQYETDFEGIEDIKGYDTSNGTYIVTSCLYNSAYAVGFKRGELNI